MFLRRIYTRDLTPTSNEIDVALLLFYSQKKERDSRSWKQIFLLGLALVKLRRGVASYEN